MSERASLWDAAARCADSATGAAFATVARQRGSLPMARDAKMLVTNRGDRVGTVGGGRVEAQVIREALEAIEVARPRIVKHVLNTDVAGDLGLSCGGNVELFIEPVPAVPEMAHLCRAVAAGVRDRRRVTVVTAADWECGPRKAAHVNDRAHCVGSALPTPEDAAARWAKHDADTFVEDDVFVERIARVPRLVIFGAGHVGAQTARVAAGVGFHVVVADDREDFANPEQIAEANEFIVGGIDEVFGRIDFDDDDYILAATRGHGFDAQIIQRAAASPARYVGMIGSRRKRAIIWKALLAAGVSPPALERVHSPVGIAIGADNPAEIAVSIVADLIRTRRLGQPAE